MSEQVKERPLNDDPDAMRWANEFMQKFPNGGYDQADLLAWFANAIMAGWDNAARKTEAALTLTWREEKPKEAGWWWFQEPGFVDPCIEEIVDAEDGLFVSSRGEYLERFHRESCQWAGPLAVPQDGTREG